MDQPPTLPHDCAIWLFDRLESVEDLGDHWQGILPAHFDFHAVVEALPQKLIGYVDVGRRLIEFHPHAVAFYENIGAFIQGTNRRRVPSLFTVKSLSYTHGRTEKQPPEIRNYIDAVKLWNLLQNSSDHISNQGISLYFIKTHDAKLEIRCEYVAADLCELKDLSEFAQNYLSSDHHKDQKRTIIRNAILETFKGKLIIDYSEFLPKFEEFSQRVRSAYILYTTDFSFEKLRSEVDKQNLDDMIRLNKTLSEIQNQLLAIPAAMLLVGSSVKPDVLGSNIAVLIGVVIFSWIMVKLVQNQMNSVEAILAEVDFRKQKISTQPESIAEKLLPQFEKLIVRAGRQKKVMGGIRKAVFAVVAITFLLVIDALFPNIKNSLKDITITTLKWLFDFGGKLYFEFFFSDK